MRCERCRAEATSTGPGGQRLCDKHYNPIMAAAPGMVGTGTTADAFGAMVIAGGVASQVVAMSLSRGADVSGSGYGERPATDPGDYPSAERTNGGMSGHL